MSDRVVFILLSLRDAAVIGLVLVLILLVAP